MTRTKTEAAKVLLAVGWTIEDICWVLEVEPSFSFPAPLGAPEGSAAAPFEHLVRLQSPPPGSTSTSTSAVTIPVLLGLGAEAPEPHES